MFGSQSFFGLHRRSAVQPPGCRCPAASAATGGGAAHRPPSTVATASTNPVSAARPVLIRPPYGGQVAHRRPPASRQPNVAAPVQPFMILKDSPEGLWKILRDHECVFWSPVRPGWSGAPLWQPEGVDVV